MPRRSPIRPDRTRLAIRASIGVSALIGTLLIVVPTATAVAARPAPELTASTETPAPTDPPVSTPLPTASPTATSAPTSAATETPAPTATATPTPTANHTATPTPTATATPTGTPTPSATATPTQPTTGAINSTSLTGRVTDQVTGAPLPGVTVYIYTEAGGYGTAIPVTTTDADGGYTFYSLDVRSYTLNFVSSDHRSEWWGGNTEQSNAATFPVGLGEAVTGIDASLLPLHSISGTVTGAGTTTDALAGATVTAYAPDGSARGSTVTSADGGYTLTDLIPGSYTLRITPPAGSTFLAQWWHTKSRPSAAAPIKLAIDTAVTGKNVALAAGASVTGRITTSTTSTSGAAIPGAWVYAYATDESTGVAGGSIAAATTNANGDYTLTGLTAGSYTLQFSGGSANGSAGYLREWWGNEARPAADTFTLTAGETIAGADAALVPTASISGTVYAAGARNVGLNAATVSAIGADGGVAATATTNGSGDYTLTGLKPGKDTLRFAAPAGTSFGTAWWHDATSDKAAGVIRVTAGEAVTGKTAELATDTAN